jgi:hypothetical protein
MGNMWIMLIEQTEHKLHMKETFLGIITLNEA